MSATAFGYAVGVREGNTPAANANRFEGVVVILEKTTGISGTVVETGGAALSGVRLSAEHRVEGGRVETSRCRSLADGSFFLPVPEDGLCDLLAELAGYTSESRTSVQAGTSGLRLILRRNRGCACLGKLVGPGGAPACSHRIEVVNAAGATHAILDGYDQDGRFDCELPEGHSRLFISNWDESGRLELDLDAAAGAILDLGTLVLGQGATVLLEVTGQDGVTPLDGVTVTAPGCGVAARASAETGRFELRGLPTGRDIRILLECAGYLSGEFTVAALAEGETRTVTRGLTRGDRILPVAVADPTGRPIAGAELSVRTNDVLLAGPVPTGEKGTAILTGLLPGAVSLKVTGFGFQIVEIPVAPIEDPGTGLYPESAWTLVVLERCASIWGTVTAGGIAALGSSPPQINLYAPGGKEPLQTATPVQVTTGSGQEWRFEFSSLASGDYFVGVPDLGLPAKTRVSVNQGKPARFDVDLPGNCLLRLAVRTHDGTPLANTTAYLYDLATWTVNRCLYLDGQGRCELPYIAGGDYALSPIHHGSSDQIPLVFTVPPGSESLDVPLRLPPLDCRLEGRVLVTPEPGAAESATFQAAAGVTGFGLAIRLSDGLTVVPVQVSSGAPITGAPQAADLLNGDPGFASSFFAQAAGQTLLVTARDSAAIPHFSVTPSGENAVKLFGASPFRSASAGAGMHVAVEWIDGPVQTLLAGWMMVTSQGYFSFPKLPAGRVRVRVVPHYSGSSCCLAFSEEMVLKAGETPFITLISDRGYGDATGTVALPDGAPQLESFLIYIDDLTCAPTSYAQNPSIRGVTSRSGYYFGYGHVFTLPRLVPNRRYRAVIHAPGCAPSPFEFESPGPGATLQLPKVTLQWRE